MPFHCRLACSVWQREDEDEIDEDEQDQLADEAEREEILVQVPPSSLLAFSAAMLPGLNPVRLMPAFVSGVCVRKHTIVCAEYRGEPRRAA